jgi:hypothetical protein
MRIDDDAKVYIWWDAVVTADPTGSSVKLEIDDATQYDMAWQGSPVQSGTSWTQTARTTVRFAGTSAPIAGTDVRLTSGRHMGQPIVTFADGQIVAGPETPVDVK